MKHIHAFTLIELLVVIAIIALLLSIIGPSLAKMKTIASRTICISNERQLVVAWLAHADENDGRFMDGSPSLDGYSTYKDKTKQCFVAVPQARDGTFSNTSLEDKIRGFERGALWSYVENPTLFNCPSDRRWKSAPVLPPSYWPPEINSMGGYRSYSIGSVLSLGGYTCKSSAEDRVYPVIRSGTVRCCLLRDKG